MSLRITQNTIHRTQEAGLNASLQRLQQTQEHLTTGKKLLRPSDNPVDAVSAMRFRSERAALQQYGEQITDGLSRLRAADDALSEMSNPLHRIRTQTLAAMNGTLGPSQREAIATEIDQLRDGMLQQANSQYAGMSLFGGTSPRPNAFNPETGEFQGNELTVLRNITDAPGAAGQINVGVNGKAAFGTAFFGGDAGDSGDLKALTDAIRAGDMDGMRTGLDNIDKLRNSILDVQSTVGARSVRLADLEALNGRQDDATLGALSKVEDTDFQRSAMDLAIQSTAYQAALAASAKMIQPSLMDFLR